MANEREIGAATERADILMMLESLEEYYKDQYKHEPDDTWLMCHGVTNEIKMLIQKRGKNACIEARSA